jgi:hypothetical protein
VLERMARDEPAKFAQLAAGLIPREALLTVAQRLPGNLGGEDWELMLSVCAAIKQVEGLWKYESATARDQYRVMRAGVADDEGRTARNPRFKAAVFFLSPRTVKEVNMFSGGPQPAFVSLVREGNANCEIPEG